MRPLPSAVPFPALLLGLLLLSTPALAGSSAAPAEGPTLQMVGTRASNDSKVYVSLLLPGDTQPVAKFTFEKLPNADRLGFVERLEFSPAFKHTPARSLSDADIDRLIAVPPYAPLCKPTPDISTRLALVRSDPAYAQVKKDLVRYVLLCALIPTVRAEEKNSEAAWSAAWDEVAAKAGVDPKNLGKTPADYARTLDVLDADPRLGEVVFKQAALKGISERLTTSYFELSRKYREWPPLINTGTAARAAR